MKILIVVMVLTVSIPTIHSQDFRTDDLSVLLNQIQLLPLEDSSGIRHHLNEALRKAKGQEAKAEVLLKAGEYLVDHYAFEIADKILLECVNLATNEYQLARVHFQLGLSFMFRDISVTSLHHFHCSLKYYQSIGDSLGIGMSLDRIADNHNYLGQHRVARPYYDQCLQIFTLIKDTSRLTNIYNNIGGMMDDDGLSDSAIWFYNHSLKLVQSSHDTTAIRMTLSGIGMVYDKKGENAKALSYHKEAYRLAHLGGNQIDRAFSNQHLGYYYYRKGQYDSARYYMTITQQYANRMNNTQLRINSLEVLRDVAYHQGEYKKAYELYRAEVTFNDSLSALQNVEQIAAIRTSFELEQKETENQALKDQAQLRETVLANQRQLNLILTIGSILLAMAFISLVLLMRGRMRKNRKIQQDRDLIRKQADKLKELDNNKSRFFANVAHDLATPITLIQGYTGLLKSETNNFDSQQIEFFGLIEENVNRLKNLTEEIRQLIKLESNTYKLNYSSIEIEPFFEKIMDVYRSANTNKMISLELIMSPRVSVIKADEHALEKIMYNLIDNGYKYNTTGSKIEVKVECSIHEISISVIDDGPGISPDKTGYVFDRFYQTHDNGFHKIAGQGIGLSLVKELVELHGGQVSVTSVPNIATCFQVHLPFTPKTLVA